MAGWLYRKERDIGIELGDGWDRAGPGAWDSAGEVAALISGPGGVRAVPVVPSGWNGRLKPVDGEHGGEGTSGMKGGDGS